MKEKLKIGILLNNHIIPSWEFKIVKDIYNSAFAEIVLVIINKSDPRHSEKKRKRLAHTILKLLDKTDRIVFKRKVDYDLKKDLSHLFRDIPHLDISTGNEYSPETMSGQRINEITKYDLDIILKFGFHILNGDILKASKYGVMTNSIDDQKILNGINPGFWEVVRNNPVTKSTLFILKDKITENEVVFNSMESTCLFSINVNRNIVFWRTSLFMTRIIKGLHRSGDVFLKRQKDKFRSVSITKDLYYQPLSLLKALQYIFHYFEVAAKAIHKKVFYTDAFNWQVLFEIRNDRNSLLPDFSNFKKLASPKGIFWADPFIVAKNDYYYIFVEEFIYKANKAHISVLKLDNKGNLLSSTRLIERQYHMSYPFVFSLDNVYYMIP
jgi:hypothetical protein